ncbi:DUF4124 domain-containing protein [Thalassotalea atypica]|uniref:DUF4124 domain-containing protein n=1 Tax=Thalassotalea atypica TaxID=2054316 RepID=UPI00257374E5|nr:DUF4124 domain-containing protein [Thalassotalea atypica]
MHSKILAVIALLSCTTLFAQEKAVYRWVDNNNIVHFSHEHPADKDYAEVKVQVSYQPPVSNPNDTNTSTEQEIDSKSQLNADAMKQNCETSKTNLSVLDSFARIVIKNEKGEDQLLTDEEKKAQIELNKKQVELYCPSEGN